MNRTVPLTHPYWVVDNNGHVQARLTDAKSAEWSAAKNGGAAVRVRVGEVLADHRPSPVVFTKDGANLIELERYSIPLYEVHDSLHSPVMQAIFRWKLIEDNRGFRVESRGRTWKPADLYYFSDEAFDEFRRKTL